MPSAVRTTSLPSVCRHCDGHQIRVCQPARVPRREIENLTGREFVERGGDDLGGGFLEAELDARLVVQAGVLDGDAGRGGERDRETLVVVAEVAAVALLGQVEVPEHLAPYDDWDAEEAPERRVMVGEAERGLVLGEIVEADGTGLGDE